MDMDSPPTPQTPQSPIVEMLDEILDPTAQPTVEARADVEAVERLIRAPALCLSGGGYRAMLFHLGTLWRLNDIGYLPKLARISSVSGGSITAAQLGLAWARLDFDNAGVGRAFVSEVVDPIRRLASTTIDRRSIALGLFWRGTVGDHIASAYSHHLYGDSTLQDLPDDAGRAAPRFVINATNVQTGSLFRFSRPFNADWRVGVIERPMTPLALAVAASSAFPPVLSPTILPVQETDFAENHRGPLFRPPYNTRIVLTDGGVYDNLGLETVWKRFDTVLVSDAGGQLSGEARPAWDWIRHTVRVLGLIDNQVRSMRKRQVIASYKLPKGVPGHRLGTYWSIRSDPKGYPAQIALPCPPEHIARLAGVPTRLKRLDARTQERLINWGYAMTDVAMRAWVDKSLPSPAQFPYPKAGIG